MPSSGCGESTGSGRRQCSSSTAAEPAPSPRDRFARHQRGPRRSSRRSAVTSSAARFLPSRQTRHGRSRSTASTPRSSTCTTPGWPWWMASWARWGARWQRTRRHGVRSSWRACTRALAPTATWCGPRTGRAWPGHSWPTGPSGACSTSEPASSITRHAAPSGRSRLSPSPAGRSPASASCGRWARGRGRRGARSWRPTITRGRVRPDGARGGAGPDGETDETRLVAGIPGGVAVAASQDARGRAAARRLDRLAAHLTRADARPTVAVARGLLRRAEAVGRRWAHAPAARHLGASLGGDGHPRRRRPGPPARGELRPVPSRCLHRTRCAPGPARPARPLRPQLQGPRLLGLRGLPAALLRRDPPGRVARDAGLSGEPHRGGPGCRA